MRHDGKPVREPTEDKDKDYLLEYGCRELERCRWKPGDPLPPSVMQGGGSIHGSAHDTIIGRRLRPGEIQRHVWYDRTGLVIEAKQVVTMAEGRCWEDDWKPGTYKDLSTIGYPWKRIMDYLKLRKELMPDEGATDRGTSKGRSRVSR